MDAIVYGHHWTITFALGCQVKKLVIKTTINHLTAIENVVAI
jgi:hypothetical protein